MIKSKTRLAQTSVADCLRAARKRIERPDRWFGPRLPLYPEKAECAYLAIANQELPPWLQHQTIETFKKAISIKHIISWNDAPSRTHAQVLAAFDKAIRLAEQRKEPTP